MKFISIFFFLCFFSLIAAQQSLTPPIKINQGVLTGLLLPEYGGRAFLGIPFAAPPVGDLRWSPPSPPAPFSGTFQATSFGPACPQICDLPPNTCPLDGTSEDCLTLEVYTPLVPSASPSGYPVMLFYYGGDFVQGGAGVTLYSGLYMVNTSGIVLVVINYRLGALGFLHTAELGGNYAIMDQTYALQWTRDNIAAFGGDPSRVTIFGQSAGAMSVAAHLGSPPSYSLFQAAIMESNPLTIAWSTEDNALKMADKFAAALNCSSAADTACLRAASVDAILDAQNKAIRIDPTGPLQVFVPWMPWVDGKIILGQPLDLFASGNYNQVPLQIGTVQDEGVLFVYSGFPTPIPLAEYRVIITGLFQQHALAVLSRYPCTNQSDCRPTMSTLATDYVFACPSRNATRNMIKYNPVAYMYHFDHLINADGNNTNIWGPNFAECQYQICHGSELPYVFSSLELPPSPYTWGPGEQAFSHSMATYWGNFGNSHSPNAPLPVPTQWPVYTTSSDTILRMYYDDQVNFPLQQNYLQSQCDFWDSLGYGWGTFYSS